MQKPGDLTKQQLLERMIRVNHAGEYGASRIYAGQLAILNSPKIQHMQQQEEVHLKEFSKMMLEKRVRPTALMPIWHIAGFALGAATALMGEKAAMACTVAVEEVIDLHYQDQLEKLSDEDKELAETIEKFRQEELEHKETALENGAEQAAGYHLLKGAIQTASRAAIWLSERV
jgi:3-demethoxyubiquinol 3-hydroxylase